MRFDIAATLLFLSGAQALVASSDNPSRTLEKRIGTAVFPKAAGSTTLSAAKSVTGVFDGKMMRFERNSMFRDDEPSLEIGC